MKTQGRHGELWRQPECAGRDAPPGAAALSLRDARSRRYRAMASAGSTVALSPAWAVVRGSASSDSSDRYSTALSMRRKDFCSSRFAPTRSGMPAALPPSIMAWGSSGTSLPSPDGTIGYAGRTWGDPRLYIEKLGRRQVAQSDRPHLELVGGRRGWPPSLAQHPSCLKRRCTLHDGLLKESTALAASPASARCCASQPMLQRRSCSQGRRRTFRSPG